MGWLEQLKPASFRGVAFQADTIEVSFGDNTVLREYPFQDLPTVFRMGEGVEDIKFSAYVIGDDYIERRDALRSVLTGSGQLMHPTAGFVQAYLVGKPIIKENPTAEGGMARFELHFVRAEARRYPTGTPNTQAQAAQSADDAAQAAKDEFAKNWDIKAAPGWAAAGAIKNLTASLDGVWTQIKAVRQEVGDFANNLVSGYQELRAGIADLVQAPQQLASEIGNLFLLPTDLSAALSRDFQNAFSWAFDLDKKLFRNDYETSVVPAALSSGQSGPGLVIYGAANAALLATNSQVSPARLQLNQLTAASDQLFETLAISSYIRAVAATELAGYDEALRLRLAINTQCTRLLMEASSAAPPTKLTAMSWHTAMQALHSAALGDLQARSRDLVRLTTYTPQGWEPVHVISFKLFGTADYADEIMAMNPHIRHPLLAPPGRELRIARHD